MAPLFAAIDTSATMGSAGPPIWAASNRLQMPLTVFDCKGIPASRREQIERAVAAAGSALSQPYEAWIAAEIMRGGVRVLITGAQGFERTATFDLAEDPAVITQRVREMIED